MKFQARRDVPAVRHAFSKQGVTAEDIGFHLLLSTVAVNLLWFGA